MSIDIYRSIDILDSHMKGNLKNNRKICRCHKFKQILGRVKIITDSKELHGDSYF